MADSVLALAKWLMPIHFSMRDLILKWNRVCVLRAQQQFEQAAEACRELRELIDPDGRPGIYSTAHFKKEEVESFFAKATQNAPSLADLAKVIKLQTPRVARAIVIHEPRLIVEELRLYALAGLPHLAVQLAQTFCIFEPTPTSLHFDDAICKTARESLLDAGEPGELFIREVEERKRAVEQQRQREADAWRQRELEYQQQQRRLDVFTGCDPRFLEAMQAAYELSNRPGKQHGRENENEIMAQEQYALIHSAIKERILCLRCIVAAELWLARHLAEHTPLTQLAIHVFDEAFSRVERIQESERRLYLLMGLVGDLGDPIFTLLYGWDKSHVVCGHPRPFGRKQNSSGQNPLVATWISQIGMSILPCAGELVQRNRLKFSYTTLLEILKDS